MRTKTFQSGQLTEILDRNQIFGVFIYWYFSRKVWLSTEGSPKSTITSCEFSNEKTINKLEFTDFKIVRESKPKKIR